MSAPSLLFSTRVPPVSPLADTNISLPPALRSRPPPRPLAVTIREHTDDIRDLIVCRDGDTLISASDDKTARCYSLRGIAFGRTNSIMTMSTPSYALAACQTSDTEVAVGTTSGIIVFNYKTGQKIRDLMGHSNWTRSLIMLPDGCIASANDDKTARVYNPHTGECKGIYGGHTDYVLDVTLMRDGVLVTGCSDKGVRLFRAQEHAHGNHGTLNGVAGSAGGYIPAEFKAQAPAGPAASVTTAALASAESAMKQAQAQVIVATQALQAEQTRREAVEQELQTIKRQLTTRGMDLQSQLEHAQTDLQAARDDFARRLAARESSFAGELAAARDAVRSEMEREMYALKEELRLTARGAAEAKDNVAIDALLSFIRRGRWASVVAVLRHGELTPYTVLPGGHTVLSAAEESNQDLVIKAVETFMENGQTAPSKWRPDQFESWFAVCVPALDSQRLPQLAQAVKNLYPMQWSQIQNPSGIKVRYSLPGCPFFTCLLRASLFFLILASPPPLPSPLSPQTQLANFDVPAPIIDIFVAECSDLVKRDAAFSN